jgi:hypothetical protein
MLHKNTEFPTSTGIAFRDTKEKPLKTSHCCNSIFSLNIGGPTRVIQSMTPDTGAYNISRRLHQVI